MIHRCKGCPGIDKVLAFLESQLCEEFRTIECDSNITFKIQITEGT